MRTTRLLPWLLSLSWLVVGGCGATRDQLRTRAAYDLRCAEGAIDLFPLDDRTVAARGCGQDAVYIEICQPQGLGKNCTWATDVHARPLNGPRPATTAPANAPGNAPPGYPPPAPSPATGTAARVDPGQNLVVRIPRATFTMGYVGEAADERPVRKRDVAGFTLDMMEVTVARYAACVKAGACSPAGSEAGCNAADRQAHPVNCVSAPQAEAFCAWDGGRLPSEEEWELAARGLDGRQFPWGAAAPGAQVCWGRWTSRDATCEVGSFPAGASPYGALDMAGNVLEWTASAYCAYEDPSNCDVKKRVARGGAYGTSAATLRAPRRTPLAPGSRSPLVGFRCARADAPKAMGGVDGVL